MLRNFALGMAAVAASYVIWRGINARGDERSVPENLWLVALCALILPMVLPKMHDRFFFSADVFVWMLCLMDPRFLKAAVAINLGSILACVSFFLVSWGWTHNAAAGWPMAGALSMIYGGWLLFDQGRQLGFWTPDAQQKSRLG